MLEGAIRDLEVRTNEYLEALTASLTLELKPFKTRAVTGAAAKGKKAAAAAPALGAPGEDPGAVPSNEELVERIDKVVYVTTPQGTRNQRSLRQCSGGEKRRLALALTLAFRDLLADRAGVRCRLLVLDEVRVETLLFSRS